MIVVQSTFQLLPSSHDTVMELMKKMMLLCQAEQGCLSYEYFVSLENPNRVILLQEWETADDLQDHYQTKHMEDFIVSLGSHLEAPISSHSYASSPADAWEREAERASSNKNSQGAKELRVKKGSAAKTQKGQITLDEDNVGNQTPGPGQTIH